MVSQKVKIINPTGLHLRPAGNLCKEAMKYNSKITFEYSGNTANAKSVLSVLGACIKSGDEITLICDGGSTSGTGRLCGKRTGRIKFLRGTTGKLHVRGKF